MEKTLKSIKNKQVRLSINNQKCENALEKGYKYDKATGEIFGQRKKAIKSKINGYTVISFTVDGVKQYLYATTFIEYVLKKEDVTISTEEIELAKVYVKPSPEYLALAKVKRKALKEGKAKRVADVPNFVELVFEQLKMNPLPNDYLTKEDSFNHRGRGLSYKGYRFGANLKTSFPVSGY